MKECIKDELRLHKAGMTNIEDGRQFEYILSSQILQQDIVDGLLHMGNDIVLLCWGGDWSNHFWFWFAWYGPGYQFLRSDGLPFQIVLVYNYNARVGFYNIRSLFS